MHESFEKWRSIFRRLRRSALMGVLEAVSEQLSRTPGLECVFIAGTIVPVYQHRRDAKGGNRNLAIDPSRGDLTTKLVALLDSIRSLLRLLVLPGARHNSIGVDPLIKNRAVDTVVASGPFDSDWIRTELNDIGIVGVIARKADRARHIPFDFAMPRWRHLVEDLF